MPAATPAPSRATCTDIRRWFSLAALLGVAVGCAEVAGFKDFTAPAKGGASGETGGAPFQVTSGGTSTGGSNSVVILTAGVAATGGAGIGGVSAGGAAQGGSTAAACGALTQPCCAGQTCNGANLVCSATTSRCETCGATNGPCCDAATRCSNNGCCVSERCVATGPSACGTGNACQAGHCANCGASGQDCCGTPAASGSCDYGMTCAAGKCN